MKNLYKPFSSFVLRAPLFSVEFYLELTNRESVSFEEIKSICNDKIILEALFIASPSLVDQIERWKKDEIKNQADIETLVHSILKYLSRMSARCTPFGLFSGCGIGGYGTQTAINLSRGARTRHTRIDMNFLVHFAHELARNSTIREQLVYRPNTSLYEVGGQYRFVEYNYVNGQRVYEIVSVDRSEEVQKVILASKEGITLAAIRQLLADEDEVAVNEFVTELVESQLIVSNLEPSVSGEDYFDVLCKVLGTMTGIEKVLTQLQGIRSRLIDLDERLGNQLQVYKDFRLAINELGLNVDLRYLFQVDMYQVGISQLNSNLPAKIMKGLSALSRLAPSESNARLDRFKEKFFDKFGDRLVPVSIAVDVDIGVEFNQMNDFAANQSPLVNDLTVEKKRPDYNEIKWTPASAMLHRKLLEANQNGAYEVRLTEADFEGLNSTSMDLPETMSAIVSIVDLPDGEALRIIGISAPAGNLLGRFTHGDIEINNLVKAIAEFESEANAGKLVAEIVHLPEARVGNILNRKAFRKYEIPYLANSQTSISHQIIASDLSISVNEAQSIRLISRAHGCEVVPRLTNAHNYLNSSLPVYHLLADLQHGGKTVPFTSFVLFS